uniref:Dynactin domain-containing protein n=6 Tax=Hymenolepis diminuta TaxID=6216 RepID=A0A0R3SJE4_HYMDI
LEDVDKRLHQIKQYQQRNLPKSINLEEIRDLQNRRIQIKESQTELISRLEKRQSVWIDLQEIHKAFSQLLEQATSAISTNRPDYPSSANLRQLKQISETIESIRQKEANYATSIEDLRSRFSSEIDSKLAEMGRLCGLLGEDVEDLLEGEENQAEEIKSKVEEIASIQTEIIRKSLVLSTNFDRVKKIIEESNEKLESLIKSKGSRGPDDILNEIKPLLTDLNNERQYLVYGFSDAVKDLQLAYVEPRMAPQFLGRLTESLQECFNEVSKRLDKVSSEATAKATVMDDLCSNLQKEMSSLEVEIDKISDLLGRTEEIISPQEVTVLQTKLKEAEGGYSTVVTRIKRIISQASKAKASDRLHYLTVEASKMISEGQSKLESLKTALKQLTAQLDKLNKSISTAQEAINVNMIAIQQNVQFRIPVRNVEELKRRLKSLELLEDDVAVAEGTSMMGPPILDKDSLMPGIASRFKDIQQYMDLFSTSFFEEVSTELQSALNIYRENLLKARESLESAIETGDSWMANSKLQLKEFQSAARDLESLDHVPALDFESSQTARMEGLQNSRDLERSWLPQQIRQVDKLVRDATTTIIGAFSLSNIDEIHERMEELQKFINFTKTKLAKATLTWETRVSEERELKQLSPILEDIHDRLSKDIDDIELRYKYASAEEAEEMLGRLQRLKSQIPVGDEISSKVRSILSSNPSALYSFPLLSKWESLSRNSLDSLINAVEEVIAEKTGKERDMQILQVWLEEFQRTIQQAIIEAQSSSNVQYLNGNLIQLKSQLKQWENDRLEPFSRKPGAKEKLATLDGIRNSIQWQIDQLERLVKEKVNSQKIIEDKLKEIVREVDGLRTDLESRNFRTLKGGPEPTTAAEVCANLRGSRESLTNIYEPNIETLFAKLYSLECDTSNIPNLSESVQTCKKKLEGARKSLQLLDENLVSQITAWEQVLSLCKNIDSWLSDHESKRVKDRQETNEFVAFPIEAFNKLESQRNRQRLETISEQRLKELDEARNRLAASDSVKELIKQLQKKTEGISEGKAILKSMLENYDAKLNEKIDVDQTKVVNSEKAHQRIKKLQQAVSNLDNVVLECNEETSSAEELNKRSENIQVLLDTEIKPLVSEDFELRVQIARGERLFQMLQTWNRERQARDRLIASERESLKVLTTSFREWLSQWNKSLEEAKSTADLELGIQLTAINPPTKFHCLDNMKTLLQEQQIKKSELEEVERKRGSLTLKEIEKEDSELTALIRDITSGERKVNRYIVDLTERCVRVERLRGSLGKARDWIRSTKKRLRKFNNLRSGRDSLDEREDNVSAEDIEAVASEMRQDLNHSLSLLQASMETFDNSGVSTSLLQVALTEVDKIDSEIEQLLSTVSQTKANYANYCVLSAGLDKVIQSSTESVTTNSSRLSDLLTRCLAGDRRIRALSPLRVSTNRLAPQVERMILELMSLDDLSWLNGSDMLVQELKFIEADIKMNANQFQSMVEQCGVLRREYSDDSRSTQVDHLFQQNNQLLRACEELIDHFSNVATQSSNWNSTCQDFVNWMDKQTVLMSRLDSSSSNSDPTEQTLTELKTLQTELSTGIAKQQAVANETQKMTVAVSRALHSANTTSTLIPVTTPRVLSRQGFDFSANYRWHNSIMSAVTTYDELTKSLPTKIEKYERRLAQWTEISDRKENFMKWLKISEQKVSESIKIIEDQEQGEGESVWGRQIQEMKAIEAVIPSKKSELKSVEDELLHSSVQLSETTLTNAFNKLNIFEARLKSHLGFMSDIQGWADDFNRTANDLESWLRQYERRPSQMDTEQGSNMLEHCRSILHEMVIRVTSRPRQRCLTRRLTDTSQILVDLSARKSTAATLVCGIVRQYQSLEEKFESMTKSRIPAKMSDKQATDWQYFCHLLRQIQVYLDENSANIHGLLPTRDFDDASNKLGFAKSTLGRLEDFSTQLSTAANALRRDSSESSSQLSFLEIERIVSNYDSSMLFAARETVSRMESVISKLRSFIDDLKKLQNDWQNYNSDVDSFRKWLRQKNRSNRRVYRKSSVEEIKNEGDHLKSLQATFLKLSGNKSQSDPELSKLQTEYRRLLMQMGHGEPSRGTPRGISGAESDRNLRAEVLSELLQTVRHIKSDVDEADRRAERGYHDLHKAFHRTLRRSKSQHY